MIGGIMSASEYCRCRALVFLDLALAATNPTSVARYLNLAFAYELAADAMISDQPTPEDTGMYAVVPGEVAPDLGGAMDLASGAKRVNNWICRR